MSPTKRAVAGGREGKGIDVEFECDAKTLRAAAEWAKTSLADRATDPTHSSIRVHAEKSGPLTLAAASVETSAAAAIDANVADDFDLLVSGRLLVDVLKALPDGTVKFVADSDSNHVKVQSGHAVFRLPVLPNITLTSPDQPEAFGVVSGANLRMAGVRAAVSAAVDTTSLPVLAATQVVVDSDAHEMTFVATDRYRLSVATIPYTPTDGYDETVEPLLVPSKLLSMYATAFSASKNVEWSRGVDENDGTFGVSDDSKRSTGRMIAGTYPEWKKLLPDDTSITMQAKFVARDLLAAINRVALVSEGKKPIHLMFEDEQIVVTAGSGLADSSSATDMVETDYAGEKFGATYNAAYLTDGLKTITGDATFKGISDSKPAIIVPKDSTKDGNFTYLIMPIRL